MAKTKAVDYAKKHKAAMEKARAAAATMKNAHGMDMGKATEAMKKMHSQYAGRAKEAMQKWQAAAAKGYAPKKPVSSTATKPKTGVGATSVAGKKIVGATKTNTKIGSGSASSTGKKISGTTGSGTASTSTKKYY